MKLILYIIALLLFAANIIALILKLKGWIDSLNNKINLSFHKFYIHFTHENIYKYIKH